MAENREVIAIKPVIRRISPTGKDEGGKRKTAAYARVSTDSDEQQNSYQAQIDYYQKLISSDSKLELVKIYTDSGISGTSTRHRKGFNSMIADALDGRFSLIITKSVSRFARNTIDSLTSIRLLKEHNVEVYFEKENIWTFDGKGEVMLTIMSSLAQDESRSISENIKWGMRKSFADGKVTVPYSNLLGFDKGPDGVLAINEKEARIVRWIFSRCLMEYPPGYIAKRLREMGVPNVHGNSEWSKQTVRCILRNEKHVGDAILQKTYSRDFLTKKRIRNNGQLTKYYVKNDHPAIVTRQQFEEAQRIMSRPASATRNVITMVWSGKFICGECGAFFGPKVWHSTDKYRSIIWKCNLCNKGIWNVAGPIPSFSEKELAAICIGSLNLILGDSSGTKELVESVIRKVIGHSSMHKAERNARLESLLRRLCAKPMKMTVNALDECMFRSLVEKITIFSRSDIRITYKDGTVADLGIRMTESK